MKTFYKLLIGFSLICTLMACESNSSSTSTLSAVAQITAFSFTANDSFPGMAEAQFIVEQLADTGLIRMRQNDSVRYGTPLDSIIPNITYYTTPAAVVFYLGDSAVYLTGADTLDLSIKPIRIHVYAQNTAYDKWYKLDFDVHKVDGDLFHWDTVCSSIPGAYTYGKQKAIMRNDIFYYYQNNGWGTRLFTSSDEGQTWNEQIVTGLPQDCDIRQIVEGQHLFFYGKGNHIYYSDNGYTWQKASTDIDIVALYMSMNVSNVHSQGDTLRIWMAARDEQNCMRFYTMGTDCNPHIVTNIGLKGDSLPKEFPIEDYATIPFQSSSLHQHALIAGGYDQNGKMTNARWSLEYNYIYDTYHLTNMADRDNVFPPFAGSSVSYYNKFMYMLGGIYGDNRDYLSNAYVSVDEGVHWTEVTDSLNSKRPSGFKGRYHTNTFVHKTNLYIIGGEDNSTTYSDVYRGRMNSVGWPEIGN